MRLAELGQRIRAQRQMLGLTQEQLAKMAELSRTTVNQIENGTLTDLGYVKLMNLLAILGLDLAAQPAKGLEYALRLAAQTASTSYKKVLGPETLAQMLQSGEARTEYQPHLMTLLEEAPLQLIVRAVHEAAQGDSDADERTIWQNVGNWAVELKTRRSVW
ncbi:XRE family transcriptional regulator [Massilia arenosa]|uniref:XRE family transcriptional regulator n=1 Tax=Zemynaea arenosa TaxID=2561931 RepID=A0A4Y9SFB1_9BURK|nr:helix-turn-helix transcriptional regulator [Massilia arenosa]TFW21577.1 XRE family transcriptional regulator [Massilia arenosa]